MMKTIILSSGPLRYDLKRTKVRGIRLLIDGTGVLRVHANPRYAISEIEAFIRSKETWIAKQQSRPMVVIQNSLSEIVWQGKRYPLVVMEAACNELVIESQQAVFRCRRVEEEYAKRALLQIKKEQTDRMAQLLRPEAEALSGIRGVSYRYRNMRTRFGSCCPSKRHITLNSQLISLPAVAFRHVLLHEYAHFYHMDHSQAFYSRLESWDDDAKQARKMLKSVSFL